jgi:hypothetical protein
VRKGTEKKGTSETSAPPAALLQEPRFADAARERGRSGIHSLGYSRCSPAKVLAMFPDPVPCPSKQGKEGREGVVRKCGAAGLDGGLTAQGALGSIACERLSVGGYTFVLVLVLVVTPRGEIGRTAR